MAWEGSGGVGASDVCVCVSLPVSQSAGLSVHLRFRGNVGVWWCLMPLFASSSPISRKPMSLIRT